MSELDRRQVLRLLATVGAAASVPGLAACGVGGGGGEAPLAPVKIGLLAPQSGVNETIGDDLIAGFDLYLRLNGNRLGGRPVQVVKADEGDTADAGKTAIDKLLKQDKVLAVTGVVSTAVMDAIKEQVEQAQVPLVGSNASPASLQGFKYIWRTSYVNDEAGRALGKFLAEQLPGRGPLYCVASDTATARDEVNGFLEVFRGAGGLLSRDPVFTPVASKDYQDVLATIRSSAAKAVWCCYSGPAAVDFVKQYRQYDVDKPLYAPGFLTEGTVLESQDLAASGIYTSMNYAPDLDNGANRTFAAEFQKTNSRVPTTYAVASYDAAAVLDKALAIAGRDVSSQTLNFAIARVGQIDSPRGTWQFNQTRTPQQKWYLRQVRQDGAVLSNTLLSDLTTLG